MTGTGRFSLNRLEYEGKYSTTKDNDNTVLLGCNIVKLESRVRST